MYKLNSDVFAVILSYLPLAWHYLLRLVCREYSHIDAKFTLKGMCINEHMYYYIRSNYSDKISRDKSYFAREAVASNNIDFADFILTRHKHDEQEIINAICGIEMLKYLIKEKYVRHMLVSDLIRANQMECARYMIEKKYEIDASCISAAIELGDYDMIQYLHQKYPFFARSINFIQIKFRHHPNNLRILKFLVNCGLNINDDLIQHIISIYEVDLLNYLYDLKIEITLSPWTVYYTPVESIIWLCERNLAQIDLRDFSIECPIELFKYLYNKFGLAGEDIPFNYLHNKNYPIIEFLLTKGYKLGESRTILNLFATDHVSLLKFISLGFKPINYYPAFCSLEVIKIIHQHTGQILDNVHQLAHLSFYNNDVIEYVTQFIRVNYKMLKDTVRYRLDTFFEYLLKSSKRIYPKLINVVVEFDDIAKMRLLQKYGYNIKGNKYVCTLAAKGRCARMFEYLHKNGAIIDPNIYQIVLSNHLTQMRNYMFEQRIPVPKKYYKLIRDKSIIDKLRTN